jgi:hypothetical protein
MRALLAAGMALFLVFTAAAPHVHAHGPEQCAVCVVRNADVAHDETPDAAQAPQVLGAAPAAPGLPPVSGAPLGAVPGQSPPAGA